MAGSDRRDFEELESAARRVAASLLDEASPDLAPRVMARIRALEPQVVPLPGRRRPRLARVAEVASWLWTPRPLRIRPALGLAAAALLWVAVGSLQDRGSTPSPSADAAAADGATGTTLYVHFQLDAPGVSSVRLAGTFTDWEPRYELRETSPGRWTALVPLAPGVHDYSFFVNGELWVPDPRAPPVDDGFGGVNSRLALVAPQTPRGENTL